MREETDFSVLYKKLIDGHFAPEQERAQAALFAVLSRLSDQEPEEEPAVPGTSPENSEPMEDKQEIEQASPREERNG